MKLARKLSVALFLGVLAVVTAFAYVRFQREIELFDNDMRRDHRLIGATLRPALLDTWRSDGEARAIELVRHTDADKEGVRIRWVWVQGGTAAASSALAPDVLGRLSAEEVVQVEGAFDALGEGKYLVSYISLSRGNGAVAAVEIAESLAQKSAYLRATVLNTVMASTAIALVCGAVAMGIGRWFVGAPVVALIEKSRRVGAGDLGGPIQLAQNDELAELAAELNAMCDQLSLARERLESETARRVATVEQLRHADRLTTVGQLASAIAHEIGTPLNVVAGHAKLIVRGRVAGDAVAESAGVIVEQCDKMTRIVRQVLDYGRRRDPKKSDVKLTDLVESTVDMLRPLAKKNGVSLELAHEGPEDAVIRVDAGQMQQALTNLIVNAMQASREGQVVRIGTESDASERPTHRIFVEDRGSGMTPATLERVFEPFFTTKEAGQGTGLGLSIALEIVREHGGSIRVDSVLGSGTRFDLVLPAHEASV
jgi:signal transduction histidine kinase